MAKFGFCSGCNRYVQLSPTDECREGHPRSCLRDIRDGYVADAPVVKAAIAEPTAEQAVLASYDSLFAKVAGKAIIILPVAAILAWGIWTGMEEFSGSGMSWIAKLAWSLFSLVLTVGLAFLFAGRRGRRH